MTSVLDRIVAAKRARLGDRQAPAARRIDEVLAAAPPVRSFSAALGQGLRPRIIAEFKRASPSAGPIRPDADVAVTAAAYERGGAAAMSVLCDEHFDGRLADLSTARASCRLPILCKDFIVDHGQVLDARAAGADAVLLIVAVLPVPTLQPLVEFVHELGMDVLAEAHDAFEIDRAMAAGCRIVGVNARDLKTFEIDPELPVALRHLVPRSFCYVAESGVRGPEDLRRLRAAEIDAVLVGTSLMTAPDPEATLRAWLDEA